MPCYIRRTNSNIEKVAKGGSRSLSKTSLEQSNQKAFSKDREISAFIWRNSDQRYILVTFFTLDPDVRWKFVAPLFLPLQGPDQRNQLGSGPHVKMDGIDLVSLPPTIAFHVDPQRAQRSHPAEHMYSTNSLTASSSSGSNFLQHFQTKTSMNKRTKAAKISGTSAQQNSFMSSDSSVLIQDDFNANVSAHQVKNTSKINKPVKKNSRKKAKKKGKQFKKPSCSSDSTEPEALCEGVCSSSTSESCANNDRVSGIGHISENRSPENATTPVVSLQEVTVNINNSEYNNSGLINHFATTRVRTSSSSEVNKSEAIVPLLSQESTGEHFLVNRACWTKATETLFSTYNGETVDTCLKGSSYNDDTSLEVFSDINSTPMLDSFFDGWNSDYSANGGDVEEKSSVREGSGTSTSESPGYRNSGSLLHNSREGCLSCGNSKGAVDVYNLAERMKCGTQGCSSSDAGKRGRQERKLSGHRFGSSGCLQGRTGKENNLSVWRKVQRNDADGHLCEPKNVDFVGLQFDTASKEVPLLKRGSNASDSDVVKSEEKKNLKVKVSEKLKQKTNACLKPEFKYYPRKGPRACKIISNGSAYVNMQQKDASDIPSQVQSNSHCRIECVSTDHQTDGVDCIPPERIQTSQGCPDEMNQCGSSCTINDQAEQNQNSTSSRSIDSVDKPNLQEVQSPLDLQLPVSNGPAKPETDTPHGEYSMHGHSSGSILQKWVPVGKKDDGLTSMRIPANVAVSPLEELVTDKWALQNTVGKELSSSCGTPLPLMDHSIASTGRDSGNISGSLSEDEGRIVNTMSHNTCISSEQSRTHDAANCVSADQYKDCKSSVFETDSVKIMQAVNDSYRIQLASEAVQLATGSPLAEFEKFLHSASPVISQRYSIQRCQTCLLERIGASLCRHKMPNVSLGGLWQWYEKHGNYGLEVKGEDYLNSKRLGSDRIEFRAYFVPFLSAVQLFSKCRNHSKNNSNGMNCPEVVSEACETDETSESSSQIGQHPIFSVLIPEPCRQEGKCSSQPVSLSCLSESSSTHVRDLLSNHSFGPACCDDPELLFEYFESEQPQQRRPLFEKVKELVRDGTSNCRTYGDPTVLNSLDLHDLHPSSWYSVAWYPIYRIPDGNFRAAFLTYHSLGHLIRRSASSDSFGGDNCIVSSVVGLQSYNAQGECWFHLRHSIVNHTEETSSFSPSEILKQRVRTLEQTASIMARASVNRGNLKSVNRQPDYEFFLSRRRW